MLKRISDLACFVGMIAYGVSHIVHYAMPSVIDEAEGSLFAGPVLDDLFLQSVHNFAEFFEIDIFINLNLSQVGA